MKSMKFLIFLSFSCLLLIGFFKINSILGSESIADATDVNFKVDKILLSTSYQNTSPRAEIIEDRNEKKILIYGGLVECSNVDVSEIKLDGTSLKIHLKVDDENNISQLIVPQVTVALVDNIPNLSSLELEVISENYDPIQVNYNLLDIINKVKADYGLYSSTSPTVQVLSRGDNYYWDISFENVYQKENNKVPIINLDVQVDIQTGEIEKIERDLVSNLIDYGNILFYSYGKGFIYLNDMVDQSGNTIAHNLYYYNLKSSTKKLILSTTTNVVNAQICNCSNNISFVDEFGNVYVYINDENKIKELKDLKGKSIDKTSWKSQNELYLLDVSAVNDSRIYRYNLSEQKYYLYCQLNKNIANIKSYGDEIIIEELLYPEKNNSIYKVNESGELSYIDDGYKATVINNDTLVYLKFDESKNTNSLNIYDLKNNLAIKTLEKDFVYYTQTSNSKIFAMENIGLTDLYQAYVIDLYSNEQTQLGKVFGLKTIYDVDEDKIYTNSALPYDTDSTPIIFSIKANNLNK
ncbi:hypothetical protein E8P77_04835 [Soehngenia saccharolytica]|nr:hypothetical protein E8P77_04835 [Soehngenia saccharolytica]